VTEIGADDGSSALLRGLDAVRDAATAADQHDDDGVSKFKSYTLREY
jgi:hypothetical protein